MTPITEAVLDDPAALDAVWQALTPREHALFLKRSAQQERQKAGE